MYLFKINKRTESESLNKNDFFSILRFCLPIGTHMTYYIDIYRTRRARQYFN